MKSTIQSLGILSLLMVTGAVFAETDVYQRGHGALEIFDNDGFGLAPQWVQYWIIFMAASFVAGLLFVWREPIARWVVGGFVAGFIILGVIAPALGITGLSGFIALVHLTCWSPALYLLVTRKPFLQGRSPFQIWSGLITGVILFSFIFDIRDAFIYLRHILGSL